MSEGQLGKRSSGLSRLAGVCGIVGSALPLVMILTATFLSPWFRWDTNALSEMGVKEAAWLFNSALMIGGALNLLFAIGLLQNLNQKRLTKGGVTLIMMASAFLSLVGTFTLDNLLVHSISALGYFVLAPSGFLLVGSAAEENRLRRLSIICGIAAFSALLVLPTVISALAFNVGFAVPEFAELLIISIWTILLSVTLIRKSI